MTEILESLSHLIITNTWIAPFIALFFWLFVIAFAVTYGFHSLKSVKAYLCVTTIMLHVPIAEILFLRTPWHNSSYIHLAWTAMPYLLLLGALVLVWLFVDQRKAKQVAWVKCIFCISAFIALAAFVVFVIGLRYLAVV